MCARVCSWKPRSSSLGLGQVGVLVAACDVCFELHPVLDTRGADSGSAPGKRLRSTSSLLTLSRHRVNGVGPRRVQAGL